MGGIDAIINASIGGVMRSEYGANVALQTRVRLPHVRHVVNNQSAVKVIGSKLMRYGVAAAIAMKGIAWLCM